MLKRIVLSMIISLAVISSLFVNVHGVELVDGDFSYQVVNNQIIITDYSGTVNDLIIPDTIDNKPVTVIGSAAFASCNSLVSVVIPEGVTLIDEIGFNSCINLRKIVFPSTLKTIQDFAFAHCNKLEEVIFPEGLNNIEYSAFLDCSSLEKITLPKSLTNLKSRVFRGCSSLKTIKIPNTVTEIDGQAFNGCASLESFEVDKENNVYYSDDGVLYQDKVLKAFPEGKTTEYVIPDWVEEIDSDAFGQNTSLTKITLGQNLRNINDYAFYECVGLKDIDMMNATRIGVGAFYGCLGLEYLVIPESVIEIDDCAFDECNNILSISMVDGLQRIGEQAFEDCWKLKSITFPNTLVSIGGWTFYRCSQDIDVYFPESITYIGEEIFSVYAHDIIVYVVEGSYAYNYAIENNYDYQIVDIKHDETYNVLLDITNTTNLNDCNLKVEQINSGETFKTVSNYFDNFKLYNIDVTKQNQSVIPNGQMTVKIPLPKGYDRDNGDVYLYENGKYTNMYARYIDGYMVFKTDKLGIFILTDVMPNVILGDINNDQTIDYNDAVMALQSDSGILTLNDSQKLAADVNNDGIINYNDAVQILKYDAGLIMKF